MRYVIIAILTMLLITVLAACTTNVDAAGGVKIEPEPAAIHSGLQAFGTLATSGTYEMELAPSYTRLARLRYNAASLLEQDRIKLQTAVDVQNGADLARTALDQARIAGEKKDNATVTRLNGQAKQMLDKLEGML